MAACSAAPAINHMLMLTAAPPCAVLAAGALSGQGLHARKRVEVRLREQGSLLRMVRPTAGL